MSEGVIVAAIAALAAVASSLISSRKTQSKVDQVAAQLQPNGGASFRDALDRVETKVDDLRREVRADRERQDHLAERVDDGLKEHHVFRDRISEALHLHTKCG